MQITHAVANNLINAGIKKGIAIANFEKFKIEVEVKRNRIHVNLCKGFSIYKKQMFTLNPTAKLAAVDFIINYDYSEFE